MKPAQSSTQRLYELLSSMKFAVSLLTVLGIASIIGTVLKQNEPYENYIIQFGQFWFDLFERLGLYDVYHSVWFLVILLFLVISTSLCIYRNTPQMLRELRSYRLAATETSLRAFSHQKEYLTDSNADETKQRLIQFLSGRGFRCKAVVHEDGGQLLAAKAGSYQRLGYILTHAAIVIICLGGLLDGNIPFKIQELLGYKKVETLDIPENQVLAHSRMPPENLSFRANMTLPEGTSSKVAFMRVRDGYLVQELPFAIALEDFRIQHYATGQPKSFESDLVILDPELKTPFKQTIKVNHPLIYKGVAIYQSDFQDGGSKLTFSAWDLLGHNNQPLSVKGTVFQKTRLGEGESLLTLEFNDFRKFNILNLSGDGKGTPHNVGPSVTFKVRDTQGQAREYVNYMQPMQLDGNFYFVSGMRGTPQEEFRYLRIPADGDLGLQGFVGLKAMMFDKNNHGKIAGYLSAAALGEKASDPKMKATFENSVMQLLQAFADGGYSRIAEMIEKSVPEPEREKAAQTYIRIINAAAFEAYNLSLVSAGKAAVVEEEATRDFLRDSMNAMSDLFFYGTPFYLQMTDFEHREASGLQLTRSPGKNLVYFGSVLLVLGIFSMIYIRERRIWLLVKGQSVLFAMSANRKNRDLDMEFEKYCDQLSRVLPGNHG